MTTLVTGATGFLGRHLVDLLAEQGDPVRALVRPGTDASRLLAAGVEVVAGDVTSEEDVRTAAAGCELVYHLAGVVSHRRRDLETLRAVNVAAARGIVNAADPRARIVHVSSVAAVGYVSAPDLRADERHAFPPEAARLPYAATKREGEQVVLRAVAAGRDVVVANPGFLLGPGDVDRVSTWPVDAYLAGRLRVTTDGGLSLVDARDVALGLTALARRGRSGERTILTAEDGNLSWRQLFELVARVAGTRRRTAHVPAPVARAAARIVPRPVSADEVRAASHWWFCTPAKAVRELGFRTRPVEETIADTLADHAAAGAS